MQMFCEISIYPLHILILSMYPLHLPTSPSYILIFSIQILHILIFSSMLCNSLEILHLSDPLQHVYDIYMFPIHSWSVLILCHVGIICHVWKILLKCLLYHWYTTNEDIEVARTDNTRLVVTSEDNVRSEVAGSYNGLFEFEVVKYLFRIDCLD